MHEESPADEPKVMEGQNLQHWFFLCVSVELLHDQMDC